MSPRFPETLRFEKQADRQIYGCYYGQYDKLNAGIELNVSNPLIQCSRGKYTQGRPAHGQGVPAQGNPKIRKLVERTYGLEIMLVLFSTATPVTVCLMETYWRDLKSCRSLTESDPPCLSYGILDGNHAWYAEVQQTKSGHHENDVTLPGSILSLHQTSGDALAFSLRSDYPFPNRTRCIP